MSAKREGIRKRGDSYLVDVTVNGKRHTRTCATYEEAKIARLQIEAELRGAALQQQQAEQSATSWTLGEALAKTIEVRWADSKNEVKAIRTAKVAITHFGADRRLDTIKTADLDDYVQWLRRQHNAPATINRKLAALSAMFTVAMERNGCDRKPRIIRQPEPTHRIRYLSTEEEMMVLSLLQQWKQQAVKEAVITLVDTGMRVGELMAMQTKDVDLKANIISIWHNKGDLPRSIPMTDRVRAIVAERCGRSRGLVFFNLSRETLRYHWDRVRSAMGLDEDDQFVPHSLRHTCATRLVQRGVSLFKVQKLLGHSTITVTERYSHLSDRDLQEAIEVLQGTVVPSQQRVADTCNIVAEPEPSNV